MKSNFIQQFCWPDISLVPEVELYGRVNESAKISLTAKGVSFKENGSFLTDTFFNSLSVGVWKKHTKIDDLSFLLEGKGKFLIQFGLNRLGHAHRWLYEIEVYIDGSTNIPLDFWTNLEDGMLYCKITALTEATIINGGYITNTIPLHDVKLGIVITHFNRKAYVVPAMKRIQEQLTSDERFKNKIDLIVVDNSQNITDEESHGATIIPNLNLGGSGGFTRGLLHLKDNNYSHCLFMDDDASCEIESIRRTYNLLQYSKTKNFAVAGSLLRELEPYHLFEKSAKFDGFCKPLKSGLNMKEVKDLLLSEQNNYKPDYGGWWFYAFKIDEVKHYAFPFFVRGDDIQFGLLNKHEICTMNGIGCWGDDFGLKSGPLPIYLDTRNHLLQKMVILDNSAISTLMVAIKFFLAAIFSYNYATVQAVRYALIHVMEGKNFWYKNMDMSEIRPLINSFTPFEKMEKINLADFEPIRVDYNESKLKKLIRIVTLNGFLLPSFLIKDEVVYQDKSFRAWIRALYRHKKVLYFYEPSGLGYIAEHNKGLFFKELSAFGVQAIKFIFKYKNLKKEYKDALPYMTSEEFWREVYKGELK